MASPTGEDGSIGICRDVRLHALRLGAGETTAWTPPAGRHLWVQVLRGDVDVNGKSLWAGDGLSASDETDFRFAAGALPAEALVFDLA
jgi:redox-sensitive bicupin YhaK (pirin superfamily)